MVEELKMLKAYRENKGRLSKACEESERRLDQSGAGGIRMEVVDTGQKT